MTEKIKIIVVDKEDNIIDHKYRKSLNDDKDIYRVTALWVTNSKGEILLAQRSFDKNNDPGKWGPAVAGTVDEGETYENNIYKEAEEELGIKDVQFKLGPKTSTLEKPGAKHLHFTQWFTVNIDEKLDYFKIQKEEVEQIKWFSKEEILKINEEDPKFFLVGIKEKIKLFINK